MANPAKGGAASKKPSKAARTVVTRRIQDVEARRALVKELMLSGMTERVTNAKILEYLHERGYTVGKDTLYDDKNAVMEEIREHYKGVREEKGAEFFAKLERLASMLEETANDAKAHGDNRTRTSALSAAGTMHMHAAKVQGVVVERQEVSGNVVNTNLNAELTTEEKLRAVKLALQRARIDEDGKPVK